jgi:hypothetical protein
MIDECKLHACCTLQVARCASHSNSHVSHVRWTLADLASSCAHIPPDRSRTAAGDSDAHSSRAISRGLLWSCFEAGFEAALESGGFETVKPQYSSEYF